MGPLLSIITINFNNVHGLARTISSVCSQTCRDFEYLIIDGGSTDGSRNEILRHERFLTYWCSERDRGVYHAMNKGIVKAGGKYLLFLNSGDCLYNERVVEETIPELSAADIVYGDLVFTGKGEDYVNTYPDILDTEFFFRESLGHPAAFIRRSLFENGLYSENYRIVSDWEFFLRKIVLESASYRHLNKIISVFDVNGISSTNPALCAEERDKVLHCVFPGMLYDTLKEAFAMKRSPLYDLFNELRSTRRFQYRIRPFLKFMAVLNDFVGGGSRSC